MYVKNKKEVTNQILSYLAEELEVPTDAISANDNLGTLVELGLNSVYFIKIIIDLENMFHIEFDDSKLAWEDYNTLNDLIEYISDLIFNKK